MILQENDKTAPWSALVPIQPNGSRPPFFYIPGAGGNALGAAKYARYFGKDQPVYGLQPLGFEEGEEPYDRFEDMAMYYLREIRIIQPEGPYYLGGPCFGGAVAFEMAQQLQAQGCAIGLLALIDVVNMPGTNARIGSEKKGAEKISYYVHRVIYELKDGNLSQLLYNFFIYGNKQRIKKKLIHLLGDPQKVRIQNVLNSHRIAWTKYHPKTYHGKITLFQCSKYLKLVSNFLAKDWTHVAAGGFERHVFQGSHNEILQEPKFQEVVIKLKECLEKSQQETKNTLPPA